MKFAEQPPVPLLATAPRYAVSTAGEWGDRLPLGYLYDGALHRDFAFKRYKTTTERDLDELKRQNKGQTQVEWAAEVLAEMLTRLGPHTNFEDLPRQERKMIVLRCYMQDVLYMLVRLRTAALGPTVRFKLSCSACTHEWRPSISLENVELKIAETPDVLTTRHELRDGVEVKGKTLKTIIVDPCRWMALAQVKVRSSYLLDFAIVRGAIRHLVTEEGAEVAVSDPMLEELSKYDFEMLKHVLDDEQMGPDLLLSGDCPACGSTNRYGLDWSWDFFFKSPSL